LSFIALLSVTFASYLVSVRQTSVLLAASFRFRLATDTLAVRLAVPLAGPALDLNQQVSAPCRAHNKKPGVETPGCDAKLSIKPEQAPLPSFLRERIGCHSS